MKFLRMTLLTLTIIGMSTSSLAQFLSVTDVEGADIVCVDPTDDTSLIYIDYEDGEENVWYVNKGDTEGMEPPISKVIKDPAGNLPFNRIETVFADGANLVNIYYLVDSAGNVSIDLKFPAWGNTGRKYACEYLGDTQSN